MTKIPLVGVLAHRMLEALLDQVPQGGAQKHGLRYLVFNALLADSTRTLWREDHLAWIWWTGSDTLNRLSQSPP